MYLLYFLATALVYLGIVAIVLKLLKARGMQKVSRRIVFVFLLGLPFFDIFIIKTLYLLYPFSGPLQEIKRVDDVPESVCWIDNVWPGFDEYGRSWMVKSYLDGNHLKLLALNGDDGKIYLYRYETKDKPEVLDTVRQLPPMRYLVAFNPVPLGIFESRFVYCDEVLVLDVAKKETIAFSRRYLSYNAWWTMMPDKDYPFEASFRLGDERAYEFDDKVLFRMMKPVDAIEKWKNSFSRSFYSRSAMDWKGQK